MCLKHIVYLGCTILKLLCLYSPESPPGTWMSVSCECCVLSGRGLCVGLITRPEESYRLWYFWVWSLLLDDEEALAHWGLLRHAKKIFPCYQNIIITSTYKKSLYVLLSLCWERGLYRIGSLCLSGITALRHTSMINLSWNSLVKRFWFPGEYRLQVKQNPVAETVYRDTIDLTLCVTSFICVFLIASTKIHDQTFWLRGGGFCGFPLSSKETPGKCLLKWRFRNTLWF